MNNNKKVILLILGIVILIVIVILVSHKNIEIKEDSEEKISTPAIFFGTKLISDDNKKTGVEIISYDPRGGIDVVIPSNVPIVSYTYNNNRTEEDIVNCVDYLTSEGHNKALKKGETLKDFCAGEGTLKGYTLQFILDNDGFPNHQFRELESRNIISIVSTQMYPVISIGNEAFSNSKLTSVIIPNSVIKIDSKAFLGNPNLTITVPDALYESIKDNCNTNSTNIIANSGVLIVNKSGTNSCTIN